MIRVHNRYGFRWFKTGVHNRLGPYVKKALEMAADFEINGMGKYYGIHAVEI